MACALPTLAGRGVSCVRPNPAALLRVVCFPHAGGGPAAFRGWAEALAPDVELWAVTLPGRAGRADEPCARSWPSLVEELAETIGTDVTEPMTLFGHSLGALLAFEVARTLGRAGREPVRLVASACAAPHVRRTAELPGDDEALLEQVERLYEGIPDAVRAEPELLAAVTPILRADLKLACSYRFSPAPPLHCPITAFGGLSDPAVSGEELEAWTLHTTGAGEVHRLPGGHFYMERDPAVAFEALRRSLTA